MSLLDFIAVRKTRVIWYLLGLNSQEGIFFDSDIVEWILFNLAPNDQMPMSAFTSNFGLVLVDLKLVEANKWTLENFTKTE